MHTSRYLFGAQAPKLDGVGPLDNRLPTKWLHPFVPKKYIKKEIIDI